MDALQEINVNHSMNPDVILLSVSGKNRARVSFLPNVLCGHAISVVLLIRDWILVKLTGDMETWMFRPPVLVGERVVWLGSGSGLPQGGVVRWIGKIPEIGPDWTVGLELDRPLPFGGIDGTWGNRFLFTCEPKHGLLVPISKTIRESDLLQWPFNSLGNEPRILLHCIYAEMYVSCISDYESLRVEVSHVIVLCGLCGDYQSFKNLAIFIVPVETDFF